MTQNMTQESENSTMLLEPLNGDKTASLPDTEVTFASSSQFSGTMLQPPSSPSSVMKDLNVAVTKAPSTASTGVFFQNVLNDTSSEAPESPINLTSTVNTSTTNVSQADAFDGLFTNSTLNDTITTATPNQTGNYAVNSTTAVYSATLSTWTSNFSTKSPADITKTSSFSRWAADLASTLLPTSLSNHTYAVGVDPPSTSVPEGFPGRSPPRASLPSATAVEVDPVTVLKTVLLALIALVAVTAHGVIIWSVVRQRFLHRPPFYYLLSFCVTEVSRALFCLPLVLVSVLQESQWRYGAAACKLFAFANCFFVYSAALALLAVAIDRHFSIVYIKVYRRRSRGLVNLVVVLVNWTVAFTVSFPPVLGAGSYVFIPEENQCTFHHRFYRGNDTLGFMLVFALIVTVAVFLYFRIFSFLRNHRKMRPLDHPPARSNNWTFFGPGANGQAMINWFNGFGGVQNPFPGGPHPLRQARPPFGRLVNLQTVKSEHLTRLFFVVTLVFSVFWLPYVVTSFWRVFGDGDRLERDFVTTAAWLTYAQVAACPVAYVIARRPLRRLSRTIYQDQDRKEFLLEPLQGK